MLNNHSFTAPISTSRNLYFCCIIFLDVFFIKLLRDQNKSIESDPIDHCNQMEGRVDSWYIRWSYACYKQRLLNIYPRISLVNNIGHDGTGVHKSNEVLDVFSHNDLLTSQKWVFINKPIVNGKLIYRFNEAFRPTFVTKIKRKISTLWR